MSGPVAFLPDLGHWAPSDGRSHTLQQLSCTHDSCRSCRSCRSCPTDYFELVKKTRRSKNLRYWGGTLGGTLPPLHLEEQMVNLHLEVIWVTLLKKFPKKVSRLSWLIRKSAEIWTGRLGLWTLCSRADLQCPGTSLFAVRQLVLVGDFLLKFRLEQFFGFNNMLGHFCFLASFSVLCRWNSPIILQWSYSGTRITTWWRKRQRNWTWGWSDTRGKMPVSFHKQFWRRTASPKIDRKQIDGIKKDSSFSTSFGLYYAELFCYPRKIVEDFNLVSTFLYISTFDTTRWRNTSSWGAVVACDSLLSTCIVVDYVWSFVRNCITRRWFFPEFFGLSSIEKMETSRRCWKLGKPQGPQQTQGTREKIDDLWEEHRGTRNIRRGARRAPQHLETRWKDRGDMRRQQSQRVIYWLPVH